jgi:isopentenyldiphosphate isomerase
MSIAQDPNELFDVVTWDGKPTGIQKRRADVHRDGDWHQAIHIWVVGRHEDGDFLLLQRRGMDKDTAAGKLDPTVGGHLGAGETQLADVREAQEEIGIAISPTDVVFAGTRRTVNEEPGVVDHELQFVYFYRCDAPLDAFRPNPAEVDALVRINIDDVLLVMSGQRKTAPVEVLDAVSRATGVAVATREELSRTFDRYLYRVAIAARGFLDGEPHFSV